jgi:hypothetical protein
MSRSRDVPVYRKGTRKRKGPIGGQTNQLTTSPSVVMIPQFMKADEGLGLDEVSGFIDPFICAVEEQREGVDDLS